MDTHALWNVSYTRVFSMDTHALWNASQAEARKHIRTPAVCVHLYIYLSMCLCSVALLTGSLKP